MSRKSNNLKNRLRIKEQQLQAQDRHWRTRDSADKSRLSAALVRADETIIKLRKELEAERAKSRPRTVHLS